MQFYRRYHTPFSLISLDIDHFKRINDSYGHLVGDKVLAKIGELMERRLRRTDIVGRMGGEEFLMLLPNTREEEAIRIAESFRQTVNQTEFLNEDGISFVVSVSGGVLE